MEKRDVGGKGGTACPYSKKCGGCAYQGIPYEEQLRKKQTAVNSLLGKFAKVEPILAAECPKHYRNKVHGVFGRDRKGNVFTGIYEEGSHRIVPIRSCEIEDERAAGILNTLCILAKQFKIQIYDEDRGTGLLRHALIRTGYSTGEIMVVLVLASPIMPSKNNFTKELRRLHPEINTIVLNVNARDTNMVLGDRNIILYGRGYIEDVLCGLRFRISPLSFYQINPVQTERLYRKAMEFAALTGKETVIDAYCGIGTIGMCMAGQAKKVMGVEQNRDAVKDAIANAKRNQIANIYFAAEDAGKYMVRLAAEKESADVVLMDPPRSGSTKEFIDSVHALKPDRVVYISCNPETLKRDLEHFVRKGWKVKKIQPVDMFPYTVHVETVVLLSKGEIDSKKVRVEFSLEDMDMSAFRKGATYREIKDYVKEQTGLSVSSLYIAQVKRKCGLEVGLNYNLSKKENAKAPQCPPEKEEAIRMALEYFRMI